MLFSIPSVMHAPFFSVILPTYNREVLTLRALKSVLAQTFRNFEVIIIDDGSKPSFYTSESLKDLLTAVPATPSPTIKSISKSILNNIVAVYESRYAVSVRTYHTQTADSISVKILTAPRNRGVAAARNLGIAHAHGHWLALLDSDDTWHPQKLSQQHTFTVAHPHLRISQCDEIWIRENVRVNPRKHQLKVEGELFAVSLKTCLITPSSVILERSLFREYSGFDERLRVCEDYELWLRITARYPVGLLAEKLTTRYQGSRYEAAQLSSQYPVMDLFRIRALSNFIRYQSEPTDSLDPLARLRWKAQRRLAGEVLIKKCRIVNQGAWKRRRWYLWWKLGRLQSWAEQQLY